MQPDAQPQEDRLYRTIARSIWLAAGVFLLFWFLDAVTFVVLFFAVVTILALALNPPVRWLEKHKWPRWAGMLLVFAVILAIAGGLGWLVIPRLLTELQALVIQLPDYAVSLSDRAAAWLRDYPQLRDRLQLDDRTIGRLLPTVQSFLMRVGQYTLSLLGLLVFAILLFSTVMYALARPRPLLRGYLDAFPPPLRDPAARAFAKGSQSVSGWLWSNVVVGTVEAVSSFFVLSLIGVPGALVWAAVTFFAELVPRLGPYLMAIPPAIVALAVDPMDALWVVVWYMVMNELAGDFLAPLVRSKAMELHPVSQLFMVLAMGSAFGFLGALLATPVAGIGKAFYEEFYLARQPRDEERQEAHIEDLLDQAVPEEGSIDDGDSGQGPAAVPDQPRVSRPA